MPQDLGPHRQMLDFIAKVASWTSKRRQKVMKPHQTNGLFTPRGLSQAHQALVLACATHEGEDGTWSLGIHYLPEEKRRGCQDCFHADWDDDGEIAGCLWKAVPYRAADKALGTTRQATNIPLMRSCWPDAWYERAMALGATNDDGTVDMSKIADQCARFREDADE